MKWFTEVSSLEELGPVAKPWVFSVTRNELWEELEKLVDPNHQQFHEELS